MKKLIQKTLQQVLMAVLLFGASSNAIANRKIHGSLQKLESQEDVRIIRLIPESSFKGREPFIAIFPHGTVVNEGGILTEKGTIFEDVQTLPGVDQHRLKNRNLDQENPMLFRGGLAVISLPGSENWYHWLLQVLPRLILLSQSQVTYDRIYVNNLIYPWQKASLESVLQYCKIPAHKLLIINGDCVMQAETLLVPSVPFNPSKHWEEPIPLWMKKALREIFLPKISVQNKAYERIYISRKKASLRRVRKEEELIAALQGLGFTSVLLEDLSPQEQASIFNQARVIIGPHGSGLANLIFTEPGYHLIELDHGIDPPRSFYKRMTELTAGLYHPYYVDQVSENRLEEDMTLDLSAFLAFVRRVLEPLSKGPKQPTKAL